MVMKDEKQVHWNIVWKEEAEIRREKSQLWIGINQCTVTKSYSENNPKTNSKGQFEVKAKQN